MTPLGGTRTSSNAVAGRACEDGRTANSGVDLLMQIDCALCRS